MPHRLALPLAVGLVAFASLAVGCHPYNRTYFTESTKGSYLDRKLRSPIIEFDDDGYMREQWQLPEALKAMDSVAADVSSGRRHSVVVVVFIHGWHNNAQIDNGNLRDFNLFADSLEQRLHADTPANSPAVLPIYIAWRGQNTWRPHWYNSYFIPLAAQYLTFFSRKATAERMGRGELEIVLSRISRKWHEWQHSSKGGLNESYLVIAGHSFGGAALLTATLPQLVAETEVLRSQRAAGVSKTAAASSAVEALAPANLLVAVNPAIEASMLDRTLLSSGAEFASDGARPQLLVLDADNDGARGFWFPLGRGIGNAFHVRTPHSRAERKAVAKLAGQVKFELRRDNALPSAGGRQCQAVPTQGDSLHFFVLDSRPCMNTVMVVQTRDKIIDGHNGIWGEADRDFLIRLLTTERAAMIQTPQ